MQLPVNCPAAPANAFAIFGPPAMALDVAKEVKFVGVRVFSTF
jgi:hypothetical protein